MNMTLNTTEYDAVEDQYGTTNAISHILRTPITCILGFSHFLNSTNLTPQQKEYVENINESAYQLLAATELLVKNLSTQK